jgi:integrase
MASGISVPINAWENAAGRVKKSHPNAQVINTNLSQRYYEIQKAILQLNEQKAFSFEALKELLNPKKPKQQHRVLSFKDYSQQLINEMVAAKSIGNALVYKVASKKLLEFYGSDDLQFRGLTYELLTSFINKLKADGAKVNTISNYLRTVRAIFNKAIKAKMVDRSLYPFYDIRIKSERTAKRAVTRQDIQLLEDLVLKVNSPIWHARNYFLLSFYLIGISFTDLAYLKHENVINGRVEYRRRKTHKHYSVKLFDKAMDILKVYYGKRKKYLLPILPDGIEEDTLASKKIIYQGIKNTNKYLKRMAENVGINATVTTYVARHTWATTAKRLGYSIELIAEAMGHEHGNKITNIYLDSFDQEVVDKMHEAVIC